MFIVNIVETPKYNLNKIDFIPIYFESDYYLIESLLT